MRIESNYDGEDGEEDLIIRAMGWVFTRNEDGYVEVRAKRAIYLPGDTPRPGKPILQHMTEGHDMFIGEPGAEVSGWAQPVGTVVDSLPVLTLGMSALVALLEGVQDAFKALVAEEEAELDRLGP